MTKSRGNDLGLTASEAIRCAQWIGMIELFGHPSEDHCYTF
jgi:hypothetical protein